MTRRAYLPELPEAGQPAMLDGGHLVRVLRLGVGDRVELFDGAGRVQRARVAALRGSRVEVVAEEAPRVQPEAPGPTLVLGMPRRPALERALRMATELGAERVVVFRADRSQAAFRSGQRWERLLVAACTQCGRARLPELEAATSLGAALEGLDPGVVLVPGAAAAYPRPAPTLIVGPEGGLTEAEVRACLEAGHAPTGLGRWVLRVDTAVAAALARHGPGAWPVSWSSRRA